MPIKMILLMALHSAFAAGPQTHYPNQIKTPAAVFADIERLKQDGNGRKQSTEDLVHWMDSLALDSMLHSSGPVLGGAARFGYSVDSEVFIAVGTALAEMSDSDGFAQKLRSRLAQPDMVIQLIRSLVPGRFFDANSPAQFGKFKRAMVALAKDPQFFASLRAAVDEDAFTRAALGYLVGSENEGVRQQEAHTLTNFVNRLDWLHSGPAIFLLSHAGYVSEAYVKILLQNNFDTQHTRRLVGANDELLRIVQSMTAEHFIQLLSEIIETASFSPGSRHNEIYDQTRGAVVFLAEHDGLTPELLYKVLRIAPSGHFYFQGQDSDESSRMAANDFFSAIQSVIPDFDPRDVQRPAIEKLVRLLPADERVAGQWVVFLGRSEVFHGGYFSQFHSIVEWVQAQGVRRNTFVPGDVSFASVRRMRVWARESLIKGALTCRRVLTGRDPWSF